MKERAISMAMRTHHPKNGYHDSCSEENEDFPPLAPDHGEECYLYFVHEKVSYRNFVHVIFYDFLHVLLRKDSEQLATFERRRNATRLIGRQVFSIIEPFGPMSIVEASRGVTSSYLRLQMQ